MATCPECDAEIEVDQDDLDEMEVGDPWNCDACGSSLRVAGIAPLEFEGDDEDEDEDEDGRGAKRKRPRKMTTSTTMMMTTTKRTATGTSSAVSDGLREREAALFERLRRLPVAHRGLQRRRGFRVSRVGGQTGPGRARAVRHGRQRQLSRAASRDGARNRGQLRVPPRARPHRRA